MKFFKFLIFIFCCFFLTLSFKYPQVVPGYFSQHGQDKFINEKLFKGKKSGFFIEIGAHDGISFSNTYFFEKQLNWKGICVEPIRESFEQLIKNRSCFENYCIDINSGKKKFLKCSGFITEMYSGIIDYYDPRQMNRLDEEIKEFGGSKEIVEVNCITFNELLKKYNINKIDLLSLDIEGGEENVIRSINFDNIEITMILVENNFGEESIRSYLISKGYKYVTRIGKDDVFYKGELHE